MSDIKKDVRQQFTRSAASYVSNPIHARGDDLRQLVHHARLTGRERVLDVGTATGHTAFAFAPYVDEVVGVDLTPAMINIAREQARQKNIANVSFRIADIDQLPFDDERFDRVTCRICAHHFPSLSRAISEMYRVLRGDGILLAVDNIAPEPDHLDEWINNVEQLRDPSHVRARKISEWLSVFRNVGFKAELVGQFTTQLDVDKWTNQSNTPRVKVDLIKKIMREAPRDIKDIFQVETNRSYSFVVHKAIFKAKKELSWGGKL